MIHFKHFCLKVELCSSRPESRVLASVRKSWSRDKPSSDRMAADKIYEHKLKCSLIAGCQKSLYLKSALGCTTWNWWTTYLFYCTYGSFLNDQIVESRDCSSDPSIFKCALSLGSSQAEGLILLFALVPGDVLDIYL